MDDEDYAMDDEDYAMDDEDYDYNPVLSLDDFYRRAKQLAQEDQADFVRFVLCGQDGDDEVVIDPILNAMDHGESFQCTRDYDSMLGISDIIEVNSYLTVYPLARKEDTLTANVHLKHHFTSSKGSFTEHLHKVPNICLGFWGPHNNLIRVFLPDLYDPDMPYPHLSQEQQKAFYEKGLRPAIVKLLKNEALEWPATYSDEFWRSQGRNGQLRFLTKVVPQWAVYQLAHRIRRALDRNGLSWHHGLVILHQVRGVKHSSTHSVNVGAAKKALVAFLKENNIAASSIQRPTCTWYVDVAFNVISDNGKCLAWRTDSHYALVRQALQLHENVAKRITSPGSSKYTRDMASHLPEVAGWRIAPGVQAEGEYECKYFQGYTTDKYLTARPDNGRHAKYITCEDVLNQKSEVWTQKLYDLNTNAIATNLSIARMEMRVPLKNAHVVLLDMDGDLIRESLVSFSPVVWWGTRSFRILGCRWILKWQGEGDAQLRAHNTALLLLAAIVWLLNGLHCTPDKGASSKHLMDAVLPHVARQGADPDILAYGTPTADDDVDSEADTDDEAIIPAVRRRGATETLPAYQRGYAFLKDLCVGVKHPVPRFLDDGSVLPPKAFKFFFKGPRNEIEDNLATAQVSVPSHPDRIRNKTRRTPVFFDYAAADDPDAPVVVLFDLAAEGYRLLPPPTDQGADLVQNLFTREEWNEVEIGDNIDEALTFAYEQFVKDVTARACNAKGADKPSHLSLNEEARLLVTEDTYKNPNLADYFRDCQWKVASPTQWDAIFDNLWLPKGTVLKGKVQNYKQTKYLRAWLKIMSRSDDATVERMRGEVKKRFDEFFFMSWAKPDRMWNSRYDQRFNKSSSVDRRIPCPLVAINPRMRNAPEWR